MYRLSAYLYETTIDSKYLDAAELTGNFIPNQMYNGTIVIDGLNMGTCTQVTSLLPHDTGYYIEALAVLADIASNVTRSNVYVHPHRFNSFPACFIASRIEDLIADGAEFGA